MDKEKGSYKEVPHHGVENELDLKGYQLNNSLEVWNFLCFLLYFYEPFWIPYPLFGNSLSLSPITTHLRPLRHDWYEHSMSNLEKGKKGGDWISLQAYG